MTDYISTILLKVKDFATEITIFNAKENNMQTEYEISNEHITNNKAARGTLVARGIKSENLSLEEDVKKVERKLVSDEKKIVKKSRFSKKNNNLLHNLHFFPRESHNPTFNINSGKPIFFQDT